MKLALILSLLAAAAPASLPDIEDEVMCVVCGTALNVSNAPSAEAQRDFIRRLIAQGKSKEEVKAALVEQYGVAVLATPEDGGYDLIPIGLAALALGGIALAVRRWRRPKGDGPLRDTETGPAPDLDLDPDDARRLDAELAAFDR